MSEPFGNLNNRESFCQQIACGAVAKIVESYLRKIGVVDHLMVGLCQIIR